MVTFMFLRLALFSCGQPQQVILYNSFNLSSLLSLLSFIPQQVIEIPLPSPPLLVFTLIHWHLSISNINFYPSLYTFSCDQCEFLFSSITFSPSFISSPLSSPSFLTYFTKKSIGLWVCTLHPTHPPTTSPMKPQCRRR